MSLLLDIMFSTEDDSFQNHIGTSNEKENILIFSKRPESLKKCHFNHL
jgi:hypothetical protein